MTDMTSDLPSNDVSAASMTMREKIAWISLVSTVVVYVPYFTYVCRLALRQELFGWYVCAAFIGAVFAQSAVMIAAYFACAFRQRNEPKDERDAAVEARAFRHAYGVLVASGFALTIAVGLFFVMPVPRTGDRQFAALLIAQLVLLCCVLAEAVRFLSLALGYRRGV